MKELLFCIALCGFAVGGYGVHSHNKMDIIDETNLLMNNFNAFKKYEEKNEQAELLMMGGFGLGAIFTLGAISLLVSSRKKQEEEVVPGQEIG